MTNNRAGQPSWGYGIRFTYTQRESSKYRSHGEELVVDACTKKIKVYTCASCEPCFEIGATSTADLCALIGALPEVAAPCIYAAPSAYDLCSDVASLGVIADVCA